MTPTSLTQAGRRPDDRAEFTATRFWRLMPAGMRRRWWLFRVFDLLARHWPLARRRRHGVLVVRMDGIGDMVLFRGSLDHYAEALGVGHDDITVLGCDSWGPIADHVFDGYRVITINEHRYAKRLLYRLRVSIMVRRLAPAVAVCDQHFRRAMMASSLVWVSGAPRTVMSVLYVSEPTRSEYGWYLSQAETIVDTGLYPTHEVVRHAHFVSALAGRCIAPSPPRIDWPKRPSPAEPGATYVVLNPGSNEYGRRWPLGRYAAITEKLLDEDYRVVFVGAPGEAPDPAVFGPLSERSNVIDLTGRTSVPELMDVMKNAAGVVTNDTGPAHLAIALGTPTVVIGGGGHFGCFVPYPEGVAPATARFVHHPMDCYHCFWRCHLREKKADSFPCVAAVSEQQVWGALGDLLGN